MKRILLVFISIFLFLSCGDNSVKKFVLVPSFTYSSDDIYSLFPFYSEYTETTRENIISTYVTGTTYYLDADEGSDSNDGLSSSSAWATLAHAQANTIGGDLVYMYSGHYGEFLADYEPTRSSYTVFMAAEGETPELYDIYIYNSSLQTANLIFWGLEIAPEWVDPTTSGEPGCDDPQYEDSTEDTYAKSNKPVTLYYVNNFKIYNCKLTGTNKYLTTVGISFKECENITIERNEITTIQCPLEGGASYIYIYYNYFHNMTASCIRSFGEQVVIEGNHGYMSTWDTSDDYCPRESTSTFHGSAIAIQNSNMVIRDNIFHYGYNSAGIMMYNGVVDRYDYILIENNLLYDITNAYVFRIYLLGGHIIFRNNTLIGHARDTTDARYFYETCFALHSIVPATAEGLSMYNNIFVGISNFAGWFDEITQYNNIFWALYDDTFENAGDISNDSKIIVSTASSDDSDYFASGFFNGTPNFEAENGEFLDYSLAATSEGINFGTSNYQPSDDVGIFGSISDSPSVAEYFIMLDKNTRNSIHHSVGCFEYTE